MTYRSRVDKDDNDDNEEDHDDRSDDVPLVVLPDDELEGLPGGGEPEEGSSRAVGRIQLWIQVGLIPGLGSWAELRLFRRHNFKL